MSIKSILSIIILVTCSFPLKLASVFRDEMVLQRDIKVPVWGKAEPGAKISVSIDNQTLTCTTGADGKWMIKLNAMPTGGPYTLTITSGDKKIILKDVLLGDVWLCSGQSNMGWTLSVSSNGEAEAAAANYPGIRLFRMPLKAATEPSSEINGAAWKSCSPETAANFSGVGYFFGRHIHNNQDVPIGLILNAWGGSACEAWFPMEALTAETEFAYYAERVAKINQDSRESMAEYKKLNSEWATFMSNIFKSREMAMKGFAEPPFDDSAWPEMQLPTGWEKAGHDVDGVFWFRLSIDLPAEYAGKKAMLCLGPIDDYDQTWFNGVPAGSISWDREGWWKIPRKYPLEDSLVKAGKNVIAVRVIDHWLGGGIYGQPQDMVLDFEDENLNDIPLSGDWKYFIEFKKAAADHPANLKPGQEQMTPTWLYNGMLHPLIPFALKGVIWYQGESNSGKGEQYSRLFPYMIRTWRKLWNQGSIPFLYVQLANFRETCDPNTSFWAETREAQRLALSEPMTGMAVTADIGDPLDIHPRNKQDVGKRLGLLAENIVYGKKVSAQGPVFSSMKVKGNIVTAKFTTGPSTLDKKGGSEISGFYLAGADMFFYPAKAKVSSTKKVRIWSDDVNAPLYIRYGWCDNPRLGLYDTSGLPASPFRTDNKEFNSKGNK